MLLLHAARAIAGVMARDAAKARGAMHMKTALQGSTVAKYLRMRLFKIALVLFIHLYCRGYTPSFFTIMKKYYTYITINYVDCNHMRMSCPV